MLFFVCFNSFLGMRAPYARKFATKLQKITDFCKFFRDFFKKNEIFCLFLLFCVAELGFFDYFLYLCRVL